ncbi:MAG: glycosyltransferase family 4 protein [Planctomycetia bacterium]|jgi:glycosyltransferase involved in cell wall biosynthesis
MPHELPRVVIDLEKLRHINCGLGRFSLHLGEELLAIAPGRFQPVFFLPPGCGRYFPGGGFDRIDVSTWRKERLLRLVRPLTQPFLGAPAASLWHVTNQTSKYMPLDRRIPVVLTIHDLTFLHEAPRAGREREIGRKLAAIQAKVARSTLIATDSAYVADDVRRNLDVGARPIRVVPLGFSAPGTAADRPPAFLPPGPFLLTLGNCLPHKNFHVLLDLAARLPELRLVIAGKNATPYGDHLVREVTRRGLTGKVLLPGEVSDGDRQWLYGNCEAFFFPSLSEGFGLPVLEAMHAGRPVIVARNTSLAEVAGDLGFYLDSFAGEALEAAYRAARKQFEAAPDFQARLRRHAEGFSWAATAAGYATAYDEALAVHAACGRAPGG